MAKHAATEAAKTTETKSVWTRDHSTQHGEVTYRTMPLGDYLHALNIWDPKSQTIHFDADKIAISIQRTPISLHQRNHILERMVASLLQGGILPAIALHEDLYGNFTIIDGLQRSNCLTRGLEYLIHRDKEEPVPDWVQPILTQLAESSKLLPVEDYLKIPIFLQIWKGLTNAELIRTFMALNLGQQKVSLRHLLEVLNPQLQELFAQWGIPIRTERGERTAEKPAKPRGRPKRKPITEGDGEAIVIPPYRLEYLTNAARAYCEQNPQVRTKAAMEATYKTDGFSDMGSDTVKRLMDLGEATAKQDFQWLFTAIATEMSRIYRDNPRWRSTILDQDNVTFPADGSTGPCSGTLSRANRRTPK